MANSGTSKKWIIVSVALLVVAGLAVVYVLRYKPVDAETQLLYAQAMLPPLNIPAAKNDDKKYPSPIYGETLAQQPTGRNYTGRVTPASFLNIPKAFIVTGIDETITSLDKNRFLDGRHVLEAANPNITSHVFNAAALGGTAQRSTIFDDIFDNTVTVKIFSYYDTASVKLVSETNYGAVQQMADYFAMKETNEPSATLYDAEKKMYVYEVQLQTNVITCVDKKAGFSSYYTKAQLYSDIHLTEGVNP